MVFALLACAIGVGSGLNGWHRFAVALSGAVLVGALDEWHQAFLPGGQVSWSDFAVDIAGSLIGTA